MPAPHFVHVSGQLINLAAIAALKLADAEYEPEVLLIDGTRIDLSDDDADKLVAAIMQAGDRARGRRRSKGPRRLRRSR